MLQRHLKYGPGNVSLSPGGPLNGLRVRLHDKLARLNNAVDQGFLNRSDFDPADVDFDDDSFRDCFIDLVGYGLIGLLVVDGDWPSGTEKPEKPLADLVDRDQVARVLAKRELSGETFRWSELRKGDPDRDPNKPDEWAVGTTFKADNGELRWTRRTDGWHPRDPALGREYTFTYPSLGSLMNAYHYADGTITEPSNLQKEAA